MTIPCALVSTLISNLRLLRVLWLKTDFTLQRSDVEQIIQSCGQLEALRLKVNSRGCIALFDGNLRHRLRVLSIQSPGRLYMLECDVKRWNGVC